MVISEWSSATAGALSGFLAAHSSATAWKKKDGRSMLRHYKGEVLTVGDRVLLHDIF